MKKTRLGLALIVSGPSGAGKSTVCNIILKKYPRMHFSISCTTREPRPSEKNGKDYYFLSKDEFQEKIKNNEFIEHAEVHGNYYGTLRSEILERVRAGKDVLLDIDVQGAVQIRERSKSFSILSKTTEFVFIGPPSFAELEKRLRGRKTEKEKDIQKRLSDAKNELDYWKEYEFLIINNDIDQAVKDMEELISTLHKCTKRMEETLFHE